MAFKRLVEEDKLPYDYTIAGSVSQAESKLRSEQFDIVISDYSLGAGTAIEILKLVKDAPVIVVTGVGNEEIAIKAWRAGAYDYLTKDMERSYLKILPITVENALRHKKTEAKLRLLSAAITNTGDSIYVTDMDSRIIFVNKAFCATYGYKEEDVLGKNSNILWMSKLQSANTRSVFRTRTVRGTLEVGFYHTRKDGSIFPVSLSRSIIKDPKGSQIAIVATARDISEQFLVEETLRKANLKLNEQNQLKSDLAARVSKTLMQLLENNSTDDVQPQESSISRTMEKARKIVRNFLCITKTDIDQTKLELTEFNLNSAVDKAVQALVPFAKERNVEIRNLLSDSELILTADPEKITQALINLIGYMVNAASQNSLVEVKANDIGSHISVAIHNNNPCIKTVETDKLFDRFTWIKQQCGTVQEEQWSLALFAAKELIEMHGASICIEHPDTRTMSFCFTMPKPAIMEPVGIASVDAKATC